MEQRQLGHSSLAVPALGLGWAQVFALGGLLMTLALGLFAWTVWPTIQHRSQSVDCGPDNKRSAIHNLQSAIRLEERSR